MDSVTAYLSQIEEANDIDPGVYAREFREQDRWTRKEPILLLADAAGTASGLKYYPRVVRQAKQFYREFVDERGVNDFEAVGALDVDDPELTDVFGHEYQRNALVEGAAMLADVPGKDDAARLKTWADAAEPGSKEANEFQDIYGVGFRTCQYLRMLAGVDTLKPDRQVEKFIDDLNDAVPDKALSNGTDEARLRSCKKIAECTDYSLLEIDQLAWWRFTDSAPHDSDDVPPLGEPLE